MAEVASSRIGDPAKIAELASLLEIDVSQAIQLLEASEGSIEQSIGERRHVIVGNML